MKKIIDISIVIVSNNQQDYVVKCLKSILKHKRSLQLEIIVVDNASTEKTIHTIAKYSSWIRIITRDKHYGFAANNNIAINSSTGRYILLLNPDTEITATGLQKILLFMDAHKQVGICGPQLRFPDGSLQFSCRTFPTWKSVVARRTPLRIFLKNSSFNKHHLLVSRDHNKIQPVDWLLGACLMIRREVFKNVGLLDEKFFLYAEDIDYCLRAWQHGWQVYYVPVAKVIHHHLAISDKKLFSIHSYYHWRSMLYYFRKHTLSKLTFSHEYIYPFSRR